MLGFLIITDFSVPLEDARQFHHVLVVFPHADDEAVTCGGSLHRFSARGSTVTLVLLTKGEKGTPNATGNVGLKDIRTKEAQTVTAMLGISKLIQEDFGDGTLHDKKLELKTFIAALIEQEQPDLLITYDLAGLYGHMDHVTCSEIITELKQARFQAIPLWYVTFPKRVLARVKIPEHMVTTSHIQEKRAIPTLKIFIGVSVVPKIKAWYAYKSQRAALKEGTTKLLPIWFFLSMMLFEYFAEVC
ncbi:MAG TPA: PIG-L family deacetylase [Ktedonobacteraceae bacterium]|nr:PIG-L family deacetylase [Ktedonobacteraceae bacterium]